MADTKGLEARVEILQDRLSRLSEASLRISQSLEVNTVLREIVANACALVSAGYGGITTWDSSGQLQEFITHGVSEADYQKYLDLPYGPDLWAYLREVAAPLRFKDLAAHFVSLGFPEDPMMAGSFLSMPVRHHDVHFGHIYLQVKEAGQEFTVEDEGILALFASLAGAAIANARKHQDEVQAKADLEALVDTSPVGVVVFDAQSGRVVSFNQETRRLVADLNIEGRSIVELLDAVTVRRADGREIAPGEYHALVKILHESITVRAEEIILEIPDGRKVTTLINATPIVSDQDEVLSVVVTMQDMTPIEEQERQRAEFLSMVNHELKAPLATVKGCTTTALGSSSVLHPAESQQFFSIIDAQADHMSVLLKDLMDAAQIETGSLSVTPEPVDLAVVLDQARNMFTGEGHRNPVQIDLPDELPRVRADQQRIVQVVGNLLSNAAKHSPESSIIRVEAALRDLLVEVSVVDEGSGIPAERLPHLFRKYARSDRDVRRVGTGLGLAICKGLIEAHGGRIWAESVEGDPGTRFTFSIPVVEEIEPGVPAAVGGKALRPGRSGSRQPLILVVDDDPQALGYTRGVLENAGYRALVTGDPDKIQNLIEARQPDLVLLDLILPGKDGIELMESMLALSERPVIFLSAYGRDETIAKALESGAADYVVKPFSPTELIARIRAALRKDAGPPEPFKVGELVIDFDERRVVFEGKQLKLTATEYELLRILSINAGKAVTYDQMLRNVWQSRNTGDARVVHAIVKKLRRKLGDDVKNPRYIFTESRVGYRMAKPDEVLNPESAS